MDMRRRLATREELSAGEDQMRRAQERLAVETVERGEQALEDVQRASQDSEVQNGGQVVEVSKEVAAKATTPQVEHAERPRSSPPSVPPPSQPPAVPPEDFLGQPFRTPQTKPEAKGERGSWCPRKSDPQSTRIFVAAVHRGAVAAICIHATWIHAVRVDTSTLSSNIFAARRGKNEKFGSVAITWLLHYEFRRSIS